MDAPPEVAHTHRISDHTGDILESERLARKWFSVVEQRAFDRLGDLVHEDVVLVSKVRPGTAVKGKDHFVGFVQDTLANALHEALTTTYLPIDEERIVVEGRIRWIDDERVIRDDPVTWAMEFRDGLLTRFVSTRTRVEAETILGSPAL